MIGGVQPKVLLSQDEDGNLHLDERFVEIFGAEYMDYKLVRERDGLTKQSQDIMWLEFDENGKFKSKHKEVTVLTNHKPTVSPNINTIIDKITNILILVENIF